MSENAKCRMQNVDWQLFWHFERPAFRIVHLALRLTRFSPLC
jgi:hypothetical protein